MKPSGSKNNEKSKSNIEEDVKNESFEIEKEKNLERFIYYTTYNDINFMEKIRPLFEEINQKAFNLRSPKEIYTYALSEEEKNNNEIDYISGFQIIDNISRLTIIEGITGKAMKKIKETFPKAQMNNKSYMIFSDSKILFNKRLYSIFDISLKFIKIRMNLSEILNTFDIYLNSNKYREIFDGFMNLGSILKAETLREITNENLFPNGNSLLLIERKYGDILKEEDLTGKKKEKKINKKFSITSQIISVTKSTNQPPVKKGSLSIEEGDENLLKKNLICTNIINGNENNKNSNFNINNENNPSLKRLLIKPINITFRKGLSVDDKNKQKISHAYKRYAVQTESNENYNKKIFSIGPKVVANNRTFRKMLKKRDEDFSTESSDVFEKNKEFISYMKKKKRPEKLWKPFPGKYDKSKEINYYAMRNNHYEDVVNGLREKYLKDKNHFYTYSELALTLSFPMIDKFRNEEYLQYVDNKSRWIVEKDFDRYKQPPKEKVYFPRIDKEL